MKKLIILLLLITSSIFSQEKKDTLFLKAKPETLFIAKDSLGKQIDPSLIAKDSIIQPNEEDFFSEDQYDLDIFF